MFMKNLIIIFFFISLFYAQTQVPTWTARIQPQDEVNIDFIDQYIENNGDQNKLNLLVTRSLQQQIIRKNWAIIDTLLDHYITAIDNNYADFDLNHIEDIKTIITQNDKKRYNVNFVNKSVNTSDNETDPLIMSFEDNKYL